MAVIIQASRQCMGYAEEFPISRYYADARVLAGLIAHRRRAIPIWRDG